MQKELRAIKKKVFMLLIFISMLIKEYQILFATLQHLKNQRRPVLSMGIKHQGYPISLDYWLSSQGSTFLVSNPVAEAFVIVLAWLNPATADPIRLCICIPFHNHPHPLNTVLPVTTNYITIRLHLIQYYQLPLIT